MSETDFSKGMRQGCSLSASILHGALVKVIFSVGKDHEATKAVQAAHREIVGRSNVEVLAGVEGYDGE